MIRSSSDLQDLYDSYNGVETVLTGSVVSKTGLQNKASLRLSDSSEGESEFPSILYSLSMNKIKIFSKLKDKDLQRISRHASWSTITLFIKDEEEDKDNILLIKVKLLGISNYPNQRDDLFLLVFELNQTTPSLLVERLGGLFKDKEITAKRVQERIILNRQALISLNLPTQKTVFRLEDETYSCIVLDISLGGMKIFVPRKEVEGVQGLDILITLPFSQESIELKGTIIRREILESKEDYMLWAIRLNEKSIPRRYIQILENYLKG